LDKGEGSSSDADIRTFWCNIFDFFKIYGVSARTRGVELLWTFLEKGKKDNFSRFVRTSIMDDRPQELISDRQAYNSGCYLHL